MLKCWDEKTAGIIIRNINGFVIPPVKKNNIKVIEDAAHALGTEYKGKKTGSSGNPTCFSFYVTKNPITWQHYIT